MIEIEIKFRTEPRFGHTFEEVQNLLRNKLEEIRREMRGDYINTQFLISEVDSKMKVYAVVYVDWGGEDSYDKIFESKEKAQKYIEELPEDWKDNSGKWAIREWFVE